LSQAALERHRAYFGQLAGWCPDPFKGLTRAVLWTFDQLLELVAGDPDGVDEAARRSARAGERVHHAADEHRANVARLRPHWHGHAGDAFQSATRQFGASVDGLGDGFDELAAVLVEASRASTEAFDGLGDLVVEFLDWYVPEVTAAAATAGDPSGTGEVRFAARVFERLAETLRRMWRLVDGYTATLERLTVRLSTRLGIPAPTTGTARPVPLDAPPEDVTGPYRAAVQDLILGAAA